MQMHIHIINSYFSMIKLFILRHYLPHKQSTAKKKTEKNEMHEQLFFLLRTNTFSECVFVLF